MAQTTKLQYWDGSRWRIPIREGQNAYLGCLLEEEVGKPRVLIANLLNTPLNAFSSTGSERIGYFNSTFTEFMDVRLVNTENHSIMFAGKIYTIEERIEEATGSKLMLTCFDSLNILYYFPLIMPFQNRFSFIRFYTNVFKFASYICPYLTTTLFP